MENEIRLLGGKMDRIVLNENYHFGGYAKKNDTLMDFCASFTRTTDIPVEPVYSGKLFFAVDDLINKGMIRNGEKITVIHTGGIYNFDDSH